jgi:ABC-2 type transport system permease protein
LPEFHIVVAKFVAVMTVLLAMIALTSAYPLVLAAHGRPDWGPVYSGYLGLALLAGALAAVGLALSALTSSQVVAGVVSLGVFGILWAIDSVAALLPAPVDNWFIGLSLLARFTPFAVGAMYTSDFGFFLTLTLLGLFLAVRALARR